MSQQEPKVVLLPHPKDEREPSAGSARCEWPLRTDKHRRKYLRINDGQGLDHSGQVFKGAVEVWAEYEAPTNVECSEVPGPGLPQYVHSIAPNPGTPTLNTDPWIFHPGFVWTICRQWHHKRKRTVKRVDGLSCGDIVLFGSSIGGQCVLDTVLVVEKRIEEKPELYDFGGAYKALVWPTICPSWNPRPFVGRQYRPDQGLKVPFSFVPSARAGNRFARPNISLLLELLRMVNRDRAPSPDGKQALVVCTARCGIDEFWEHIKKCVFDNELLLGTEFSHP